MQSAAKRKEINRLLGSYGLGQLEDAGGLLAQLGYMVRDHDHLRQLLIKCEPEYRRAMYDSLKGYLRFAPRSLDDYIIEAKRDAEVRQLPTLDPETGLLRAYRVPEIGEVQDALEGWNAKGALELTCKKCTRSEVFAAATKADAVRAAREAGWTYDEIRGDGREVCPICPGFRPQIRATVEVVTIPQ